MTKIGGHLKSSVECNFQIQTMQGEKGGSRQNNNIMVIENFASCHTESQHFSKEIYLLSCKSPT